MRKWIAAFMVVFLAACDDATGPGPVPTPAPVVTTGVLRVQNSSAQTINRLYYSPCANTSFGPERLQGGVIAPNSAKDFTVDPDCYDVRVYTTSNLSSTKYAHTVTIGNTTTVVFTN
jgi:hypothetical protein